ENKRTEHNNNVTLLNSDIERPVEQGYDTVMQVDSVDTTPDITYAESNDLIFVNNIDTSVNVDPVLTEAKGIKSVTPYIDVKSEMYEFRKAQREDPSLKHIFDQLKDKNNINSDYFVLDMDGLLYRSTVVNDCEIRQLVAPESRRLQILEIAHNSSFGDIFRRTRPMIELNFHSIGLEFVNTSERTALIVKIAKTLLDKILLIVCLYHLYSGQKPHSNI